MPSVTSPLSRIAWTALLLASGVAAGQAGPPNHGIVPRCAGPSCPTSEEAPSARATMRHLSEHSAIDPHNIQAGNIGDRVDLSSRWLFHAGSDPAFATPGFDDSHWMVVDGSKRLSSYGMGSVNEIWYRAHVHFAPGGRNLALYVSDLDGSYRIYVNGKEIGGLGRMADRGEIILPGPLVFPLDDQDVASGDVVVAVHAFVGMIARHSAVTYAINRYTSIYLGPQAALLRDTEAVFAQGKVEEAAVLALWGVVLALSIGLALLVRRDPAYIALAAQAACVLLQQFAIYAIDSHYVSRLHPLFWARDSAFVFGQIAELELAVILVGLLRRRWTLCVECALIVQGVAFYIAATGVIAFVPYRLLEVAAEFAFSGTVIYLLFLGLRRGKQDIRILALPVFLYELFNIYKMARVLVYEVHIARPLEKLFPPVPPFHVFNWTTDLGHILSYGLVFAFLIVVIARTLRIVSERATVASEIAAAQTMQQLLLARSSEPTPGFLVESVYHPASEVGGDFFLVSPGPDGSLTAIVGDVSGKGLVAAMRVSMILGVLRREDSREPAAILRGLNEALLTEGEVGFTTACCVRLERSGRFSVANAGHISPYLGGREMESSPALPLGLAADQIYDVIGGNLCSGERLVLMSDGVVEARAAGGELYGFERLAALTLMPAQQIADTA
jgi:hypothetical protein